MADTDPVVIERPEDRLTVQFKKAPRELFMSYARLQNCLRMLDDPNRMMAITLDPDLADDMLKVVFADTIKIGDVLNFEIGEEDIGMDDAETVLSWIQKHVAYFFMRRFQQLSAEASELEPLAQRLRSSLGGSTGSSSTGRSAGPSA